MTNIKIKYFYIEITNLCNLSCSFCPSGRLEKKDYQFISKENFATIIKKIKPYTKDVYLHILGEPTLHPHLLELLDICISEGINCRITTNGTNILDSEVALNHLAVKKVNFSLQSLIGISPERRSSVLNDLIFFIEHKRSELAIDLRLWNDSENHDVKIFNSSIDEVIEINHLLNHHNVRISREQAFLWPDITGSDNQITSNCLGGRKQLGVLVDGRIVLCCLDYLGETTIGNIYQDSLEKIFKSEFFNQIVNGNQNQKPILTLCQKCTYRNRFR